MRQLTAVTLSKLYDVAERLPLFSQINALQGILPSKDAFDKKTSKVRRGLGAWREDEGRVCVGQDAKLGMLDAVTLLCKDHGTHVVSSLPSITSTGVKDRSDPLAQEPYTSLHRRSFLSGSVLE